MAVLSNDIDGNGIASPLTDGLLLIRHLSGYTGSALTQGALGAGATRTDPTEIASYIDSVLNKLLYYTDPDTSVTSLRSTLDFDGDGGSPTAAGDGTLMARYLAGFRDGALTQGISAADGADVVRYIETGRTSASQIFFDEFGKIIDRNGLDLLGVKGSLAADRSDGSSASAAADPNLSGNGASPEFALAATNGAGAALQTLDFLLSTYGQSVMFNEIYMNGTLISRVAEGSPLDFGDEAYRDLINSGVDPGELTSQQGAAVLGVEEPIFVKAPDAAGYQYDALDGFGFNSFFIDPQVGGNLLLPSEFDLYLQNDVTHEWEYAATISGKNPAQVGINGFLHYEFAGGPVSSFRLYSRALPNEVLHDADNQTPPQLIATTGFLLSEPAGGSAMPPTIRMTPLAERQLFTSYGPVNVASPVFSSDTAPVTTTFGLTRSGADVIPTINSVPQDPIPLASAVEIRVEGHDNVDDTLILNTSGGPLTAPLVFNGGFRFDTLSVDSIDGAGVTIDLVNRDAISEVELVDMRGSGANQLILDHDAVIANDLFTQTLRVRGNADDSVVIGDGWILQGNTNIDGVNFSRYVQGRATLLIEAVATISAELPAGAGAASGSNNSTNTLSLTTVSNIGSSSGASSFDSGALALYIAAIGQHSVTNGDAEASAARAGAGSADGAAQVISASTSLLDAVPGSPISIFVAYSVASTGGSSTPGLHLRMHFDSSKLSLDSLSDVLPDGLSAADVQSEPAVGDLDGDPTTDAYVNLLWLDIDGNWPGEVPASLYTANFTVDASFSGTTHVNFTGDPAAGFDLVAPSIAIGGLPGDYNGDHSVDEADFDLWKSTFGTSVTPGEGADGNANGVIDAADYTVWRDHFGLSIPGVGAAAGEAASGGPAAAIVRSAALQSDFLTDGVRLEAAMPTATVDVSDLLPEFVKAIEGSAAFQFGTDLRRGRVHEFRGATRLLAVEPEVSILALLGANRVSAELAFTFDEDEFHLKVPDDRPDCGHEWYDAVDEVFSRSQLDEMKMAFVGVEKLGAQRYRF